MSDGPPVKWIPKSEIRAIFNEMRLYERMLLGEFIVVPARDPIAVHYDFLEPGSTSQVDDYFTRTDDGTRSIHLATVHYYMQPSGKMGASGKPDPTYVFHDGIIYKSSPDS